MSVLTWTREKPTVPGWYWLRDAWGAEILSVEQHMPGAALRVYGVKDSRGGHLISDFKGESAQWWMGPLPVPEAPKEQP